MTYVLCFFFLRLRLRSTAEGRSFSWPNIWLRPKVKIMPTVQHWSHMKADIIKFAEAYTLASGGFGNDGGQNEKILGENSKIANFLITAM